MEKFDTNGGSFIRTRINENLLKVKDEPSEVKSLLSLSLHTSKPHQDKFGPTSCYDAYQDINLSATRTKRSDLLRTCILLATSRNTIAQENLIEVISKKLGKLKDKDYKYIANLICMKESQTVERVNTFLSYYLEGFEDLHKKYYKLFYAF